MKHIYYFIGLMFLIRAVIHMASPATTAKKSRARSVIAKKLKAEGFEALDQQEKNEMFSVLIFGVGDLLWLFLGLLTFNWLAFAAYLIITLTVTRWLSKLTKDTWLDPLAYFLGSLIFTVLCGFVIINSYHLHIDLWALFNEWIKTL